MSKTLFPVAGKSAFVFWLDFRCRESNATTCEAGLIRDLMSISAVAMASSLEYRLNIREQGGQANTYDYVCGII
jgi:hypothetical protein